MENPKIILLYLFTNAHKDDDKIDSKESNDTHKNKKLNNKDMDEQIINNF
jgi:hypothetical protein